MLIKTPSAPIKTIVNLPASKSISNRLLIMNELAYSPYPIGNLSDSDDTQVLLKALHSNDTHFDIGAAGTAMRFLTAYLSKIVGEWHITGTERMKNRPIKILVDALNTLGARIEYEEKDGFPPLRIFGSALSGGEICLDGSISSQYISALLMIAPTMQKGLTLRLTGNIISKPYIRLTLELMKKFGIQSDWNNDLIHIPPQTYVPKKVTVESDWSAASYWYEIAALSENADIELTGLSADSFQGDAAVANLFEPLGVKSVFLENGNVKLQKIPIVCDYFEYDFTDQPDLAQTFAVTCTLLQLPFKFSGLQTLKIKETDRIEALKTELGKLGFVLQSTENSLSWQGKYKEADANSVIATYEDHRMAMAFAPVALKRKEITIANPHVVSKSYPNFWEDLKAVGFKLIDNGELTIDNEPYVS